MTGDARYWFYKLPDGGYELFDGPGFHPRSQEPLLPVTPQVVQDIVAWIRARQQAGQESVRVAYVDRYVDRSVERVPGVKQWALLIIDADDQTLPPLTTMAREALTTKGASLVPVFRPLFEREMAGQLYRGDPSLARRLSLDRYCDGVILGKVSGETSQDANMQGMITARLSVSIRLVSASSGSIQTEFRVDEKGGGFSIQAAKTKAAERAARAVRDRLLQVLP